MLDVRRAELLTIVWWTWAGDGQFLLGRVIQQPDRILTHISRRCHKLIQDHLLER